MPSSSKHAHLVRRTARAVLAENMVRLRRKQAWSQEQLGFEAGLHRTFIAHVERQSRNLSLDSLERIAVALQVEPYELLTPETEKETQ
ncbi:helix-turn-helix domain-containing protein [Massilia sp. NP310]|nr:helix-turn-helix domain-containing protein [Massilia sp. NP310]